MSKLLLTLCLIVAILIVPTSAAVTLCPWNSDPQTFVPTTPINVENLFAGKCEGVSTICQESISTRVDNGTQIVASNMNYLGSLGNHDIALQSTITNRAIGVSVDDTQDFKYSGLAASLSTSQFGMEVTLGTGNDTPVNCNEALSGTNLVMTEGEYASTQSTYVQGHLGQSYAMAAIGDGYINTYGSSVSRTGLQMTGVNKTPQIGYQAQKFSATFIGKYDIQNVYTYRAGLITT